MTFARIAAIALTLTIAAAFAADASAKGKGKQRLYVGHLQKLKVDQKTIDHLVAEDKPELVAALVKKLIDKSS